MYAIFALGCQHQYLVIEDAQVIAGTPQYYYTDVGGGRPHPTLARAARLPHPTPHPHPHHLGWLEPLL
jgi:hypothetical protein